MYFITSISDGSDLVIKEDTHGLLFLLITLDPSDSIHFVELVKFFLMKPNAEVKERYVLPWFTTLTYGRPHKTPFSSSSLPSPAWLCPTDLFYCSLLYSRFFTDLYLFRFLLSTLYRIRRVLVIRSIGHPLQKLLVLNRYTVALRTHWTWQVVKLSSAKLFVR